MPFLTDFPQTRIVCETAKKKKTKVYLVGGFIRDHMLKRPCLDFDFAVEKDAISFAKLFAQKIKGAFVLLDKEHGCARVAKKTNGTLSTFDFADFRGSTLIKDLSGRDFTINTLVCCMNALDPSAELDTAIKDLKRGKYDIKAKRIKMVSVRAFKDDPLRLLRAFSLKAMLGFKIEEKTLRQIKKDRDLICDVSYERIRDELFKMLKSPRAAETLKALDRIGLLSRIIPQVEVMFGVKQGTYHHMDVWPHSLETVKQLDKIFIGLFHNRRTIEDQNNDLSLQEKRPEYFDFTCSSNYRKVNKNMKDNADLVDYINQPLSAQRTRASLMKLAALLHDIGKPDTRKKEPGRISFHGHERVGKSIARSIAKMLKLSTRERFALQDMVLFHLRPGYLSNFKQPSKRALFRYFRATQDEAVSIVLLSLADQRATRGPLTTVSDQKHHEKICLNLIGTYFKKREEKPFVRFINGDDLIKKLKLKPSPLFKIILEEVEEKQVTGKIKNKDEAIVLAEEIAKRKSNG